MRSVDVTWLMLDGSVVAVVEKVPLFDANGAPAGHRLERTLCRVNIKGNIVRIIDWEEWQKIIRERDARAQPRSD